MLDSKQRLTMPLISHVNWRGLDRLVINQQKNRSAHVPVISFYRWWARRSHCFAGAVLDAAKKEFRREKYLVSDPFSGGGTVAFEAARRGLPLYAQDLYPWPSRALATALTRTDPDEFRAAAARLLTGLTPLRKPYWQLKERESWETTHIIRVRVVLCAKCDKQVFAFRDPLVSLRSRSVKESLGFFGCCACGAVSLRKRDVHSFSCDRCSTRSKTGKKNSAQRAPELQCPHCFETLALSNLLLPSPRWHPVLVREQPVSGGEAKIRGVERGDPVDDLGIGKDRPVHVEIPTGSKQLA